MKMMRLAALLLAALMGLFSASANAEDGYDLWLRYRPVEAAAQRSYRASAASVVNEGSSPALRR